MDQQNIRTQVKRDHGPAYTLDDLKTALKIKGKRVATVTGANAATKAITVLHSATLGIYFEVRPGNSIAHKASAQSP